MVPSFDDHGKLPTGIHWTSWKEFSERFGTTLHRRLLLKGLLAGIIDLRDAGCRAIYIDGSFVTDKEVPNDFDACWDITGVDPNKIDPILLTFDPKRVTQKAKYHGEFFPAQCIENGSGKIFLEFLSSDEDGRQKGIVALDLGSFDYD